MEMKERKKVREGLEGNMAKRRKIKSKLEDRILEKEIERKTRGNPFETSWTEVLDYGMWMMNSEDSFDCTTKSSHFQKKERK